MTEFKFDRWQSLYAERTLALKSSEIRDLLSVATRPDIISLAGGFPYTQKLAIKRVVEATEEALKKEGKAALQYGPSEGHEGLKKHIIELMAAEEIRVENDDILITDGAQQGLDLIGKVFINPGDRIIVEAPTYVGALQAFLSYEAHIVSIPLDDKGMKITELERLLKSSGKQPVNPLRRLSSSPASRSKSSNGVKFLYTVPNFHNPAGVTLAESRRKALLELAKKHDLLIIEDNPYGLLRFEGNPLKSLRARDDSLIYLGTFSKIFSPGLRLGWVVAPRPILEKLIFAKQAADLCSSSFAQIVVEEYFTANRWRGYLQKMREIYKERRDMMLKSLKKFFPKEVKWTKPEGGFFVWVTLPKHIDTTLMLAEAIREEKVAYVPGSAFFAGDRGKNSMRLAFCYPEKEEIFEGVKRLAKVVKRQMELYKSVTKKLHL